MPKHFPTDLALVILFTLLCIPFVIVSQLHETPVRIILGLPLVLFLPGYSLIAVLFPRKDDLEGIERIALSFGLSIAVVPLLGLALNYTPFGIRLTTILGVLSIFTISLALGAVLRRYKLPEDDRFAVEFVVAFRTLKNSFTSTDNTKINRILSVILVIAIVLAISMTIYVIVTPKRAKSSLNFIFSVQMERQVIIPQIQK